MRYRKSVVERRTRRRRFLLQMLIAVSLGAGSDARAEGTALAFYTADPAEMTNQVITVSHNDLRKSFSILQAAAQLQEDAASDQSIHSSSDFGDSFLTDPLAQEDDFESIPIGDDPVLAEPEPPVGGPVSDPFEDVDAVVDQAIAPQAELPPPQPRLDLDMDAINSLAAPAAPSRTRSSLGAVAGGYSSAPNMIGDFFGATFMIGSPLGHTVALAGGDRRVKIAENTSPIPQDRVFFNYNHFHNALRDVNEVSQDLDRFTFGVEKTFLDGLASIEARVPFSSALNSTQTFDSRDLTSTEFGNIATTLKFNLLSGSNWLMAGGATLTFPTGDDFVLADGSRRLLVIQNEAYHLAPFIGLVKINRRWFAQGFVQTDFDLNGYDVFTDSNGFEGVLQDQHLLFIDASIGNWLYRNCNRCAHLTGVAALAELHYTTTMQDTDAVAGVRNNFNRMDILNATGALNFQFRRRTSLRIGAAAPLRGDEENLFDAEILLQLNHNY